MLPFPGGIEAPENAALLFSAAAALLYTFILDWEPSLLRSAVKTISTALLAYLAWTLGGPPLLVAGLVLGSLGDLFLSRTGDRFFLAGLVSFLVAHVAYIKLFLDHGIGFAALDVSTARLAAIALVVVFSISIAFILLRRVPPTLRLPVLAYTFAIMLMGVSAMGVPNWMVVAGALMFMASDTLLAWERFVSPAISSARPLMRIAVWVLYYLAQLAITLGFVLG